MKYSALSVALFAAAPLAWSAPAVDVDETLIVTGDRLAQSADSVLAPVTVIDRASIVAMQAKSLSDILRTLPNVDVNQYGGRGQNATVTVRGATSAQSLVLIDGMRSTTSALGPLNINNFPVAEIERIEFIRGARASVYGSEAVAGVINIITRDGRDGTTLTAGAGSFEQVEASVRHQSQLAGGTLKAVLAYEDEEGYNVHPVPGVNDGDKHGFTGKSALLAYDRAVTERLSLYAAARWFQNESQYDNSSLGNPAWGAPDVRERKENRFENVDYQLEARYQGERWHSSVQAQYSDSESQDFVDTLSYKDSPDFSHLRQYNLAWVNRVKLTDAISVGAGLDWRDEQLRGDSTYLDWATGVAIPFADGTLSRDNTGAYALLRVEEGGHQFEASVRSDDNEQYGQHTTWQVGGRIAATDSVALVASVGTAFRAPTFYDLYYPGSGNPDLRPETAEHYELALEGAVASIDWRLGWYRQDAEDLIQFDSLTYRPVNIGEAVIDGIEAEAAFDTGPVHHQLSYGWRDSEDRTTGNELAASARHNAKWNLSYDWDALNLTGNLVYRGSRWGDAANTVKLDAYFLVNLAASYQLTESLALRLRLENLLDEEYVTIADTFSGGSYPGQERSVYGQVEYRL
ncbi:TonB-dependent receptor domain-containing protein [Ferrimonas balearica]|uniref:TonB-dependent receptor domain-containing protein n=1 Tax=Ferrimonas balearica TaxID=44012 RepID=UPI001C93B381|nr:TonB-dependent receptor [Ferrimonas balearica]MBY6224351.1 TonB-dependent receptor [Ferrimonas balearica]